VTKPPVVNKAAVKKRSLAAINAAAAAAPMAGGEHVREVFVKLSERYISHFLSGELCCLRLECLCATVQPRDGLLRGHAQRSIHRH
jgi:hypothetical protein